MHVNENFIMQIISEYDNRFKCFTMFAFLEPSVVMNMTGNSSIEDIPLERIISNIQAVSNSSFKFTKSKSRLNTVRVVVISLVSFKMALCDTEDKWCVKR